MLSTPLAFGAGSVPLPSPSLPEPAPEDDGAPDFDASPLPFAGFACESRCPRAGLSEGLRQAAKPLQPSAAAAEHPVLEQLPLLAPQERV